MSVSLLWSLAAMTLPRSVTKPEGASSVTFKFLTYGVNSPTTGVIDATTSAAATSAVIRIN